MINWFKRESRHPASCIKNMPLAHIPELIDNSKLVVLPSKEEESVQRIYNILTQLMSAFWAVPDTLNFVIAKVLIGLTEQDICLLLTHAKDPKLVQLILDCRPHPS